MYQFLFNNKLNYKERMAKCQLFIRLFVDCFFSTKLPFLSVSFTSDTFAISGSCVTIITHLPSLCAKSWNKVTTSLLVRSSKFPVGSSATINSVSQQRARAIETRCCWPPLNVNTFWRAMSSVIPTFSSILRAKAFFIWLIDMGNFHCSCDIL